MTLARIAPGVDRWVMPEASMSAVVVADAGEALVVDPGTLPSRAAELRAAIERLETLPDARELIAMLVARPPAA